MSTMRGTIGLTPDPRWRVILVGRTGLDQAMRRDPGFELIRARDAIDAIGELSDPIDHHSPEHTVVVVSPDAEPAGEECRRFLGSLRRVDPGVAVLRVGDPRAGYDGCVGRDADAADLREVLDALDRLVPEQSPARPDEHEPPVLRFREPEHPGAPVAPDTKGDEDPGADLGQREEVQRLPDRPAGTSEDVHRSDAQRKGRPENRQQPAEPGAKKPVRSVPHEAAISAVSQSKASAPTPPGDDGALARALLSGHSVLEPAMAIARLRAGRDDLNYDANTGRLVCDDAPWATGEGASVLASLSSWLSAWVRLDAQHRELRHAAFTDPLTNAWNRRYFERFMDAAIAQAREARRTLTLMVFDIDNFKVYNDAFGHGAGDEILTETVKLLNSVIRPTDRVCRVGGDEFAVIFYEPEGPRDAKSAPPESIYGIATRFQKQICSHKFPKLSAEAAGTLTISGGLATFPWDGHNAATLLERADQLSMASKRQGKNALTFGQGAEKVCRITDPE